MPEVLGLITARGGSRGVPRKNVRPLAGRPLIAWTIDAARASQSLDRVIVSTEDDAIASVARAWGADVPFHRPMSLAGDASPHIDVVLHALDWLNEHESYCPEYVVLLQPTSPLRTAEDIDAAVELAIEKDADAVATVVETHDHPYLTRRLLPSGVMAEFVSCDLAYARRQDLPAAYALNGAVFVNRPRSLVAERMFCPPQCHAYVMPAERSAQIDTPWDFHVVELILRDRLNTPGSAVRVAR
ncbi:MAG: cytidylyltransferase domain-containing protein [Phycisphaerae bacterium]